MTEIFNFDDDITLIIAPIAAGSGENRRDAERRTARELVSQALGGEHVTIGHHPSGAPFIDGHDLRLSVSHSRDFAAIAVSPSLIIGIDIEQPRGQLRRVAPRVLSPDEMAFYGDSEPMLLRAWTLKEALYKAALTPGLDFRRDIRLPLDPASQTATVAGIPYSVRTVITTADYTLSLVAAIH